jgi:CRISPR/Cas system CMR subunit Cmr4 (Cas7 group RAMP superfamily)
MTPALKHFHLARLTFEAATPLSIAAGDADGVFDVSLARDANGLPTLPGSAIAGVLRHLHCGTESMEPLFGFQEKTKGEASRVHVSWGALQDSTGRAVEGLLLGEAGRDRLKDPLLAQALSTEQAPLLRDRVRISHRGMAADKGKFDRAILHAGHRFSAEISLWSEEKDDPSWLRLLNLLTHPLFRIGGGTRAGLGRIKVVRSHGARFDLTTEEGRKAFATVGSGLDDTSGLQELTLAGSEAGGENFVTGTLILEPRAFWRIGQGDEPQLFDSSRKPADLLPKLESRVIWDAHGRGTPGSAMLLIPGSSIKGALAHRVAFHANLRAGRWIGEQVDLDGYDKSEACPEVRELFGFARDDKKKADGMPAGRVGHVLVDDAFLTFAGRDLQLMTHNAIDRFTGGVREHMLFMEELVWQKKVEIPLAVDTRSLDDATRIALRDALDDLRKGRLAIGGGAAKGHGFCDGRIRWSDGGSWIEGRGSKGCSESQPIEKGKAA